MHQPRRLTGLSRAIALASLAGAALAASFIATAAEVIPDLDWLELLPETERANAGQMAPLPGHDFLNEDPGQALPQEMSFTVNPTVAGRLVRVPGFVVPLELNDEGEVTEFFLVPYFGACIHMPPPPPNQIIHVTPPEPFRLPSLQVPYWVTGPINLGEKMTKVGASAYEIKATDIRRYQR